MLVASRQLPQLPRTWATARAPARGRGCKGARSSRGQQCRMRQVCCSSSYAAAHLGDGSGTGDGAGDGSGTGDGAGDGSGTGEGTGLQKGAHAAAAAAAQAALGTKRSTRGVQCCCWQRTWAQERGCVRARQPAVRAAACVSACACDGSSGGLQCWPGLLLTPARTWASARASRQRRQTRPALGCVCACGSGSAVSGQSTAAQAVAMGPHLAT